MWELSVLLAKHLFHKAIFLLGKSFFFMQAQKVQIKYRSYFYLSRVPIILTTTISFISVKFRDQGKGRNQ